MFKIRLAELRDAKDVFLLSNNFEVRKKSFNSITISWDEHVKWFQDKIRNKNCVYYIIQGPNKEFIGQVRFDMMQKEKNSFVVGISLVPLFRGKGLGAKMLQESTSRLFRDIKVNKIYAFIKENNQASLKSFLKIGYKIVCKEIIKGVESFKLSCDNMK